MTSSGDRPARDPRGSGKQRLTVWVAAVTVLTGRGVRAAQRASGRATRVVSRQISALFTVGGAGFRDLAISHAASTAGDTAVTVALAGTLFFSVPSGEARTNVALYLLLTIAPFAIIGPLLGRLLDRHADTSRLALVFSAGGRVVLAVLLALGYQSWWLFPAAFALLVLSRTHGIARNAMLPLALDEPIALVTANAYMARIGVLAGVAIAPVAVLAVRIGGAAWGLGCAGAAFVVAALAGLRLPSPTQGAPAGTVFAVKVSLPRHVRLAQLATAAARWCNGFLLLLLAFAFRELDAPLLDFGAVLAAGGGGYALASVSSPALEARLREEPMVVMALAVEAGAAFVAGQWFGLSAAAILAGAAGFAWGTAKFAFDGLLQQHVPPARRGAAFTRSETLFQLAWVGGAVVPTALPIPTSVALSLAGLVALGAQVTYVAKLLLPPSRPPAAAGRG